MVNTLFNCCVSFQSFYNQEVLLYNFLTDVSCLVGGGDQGGDQIVEQSGVKSRGGDQGGDQLVEKCYQKLRWWSGGEHEFSCKSFGSLAAIKTNNKTLP